MKKEFKIKTTAEATLHNTYSIIFLLRKSKKYNSLRM